jgi:hypothetical protein
MEPNGQLETMIGIILIVVHFVDRLLSTGGESPPVISRFFPAPSIRSDRDFSGF